MKILMAALSGALLAVPALAETYSGTGRWISFEPGSDYTAGDSITWSFTTGAPIPELGNIATYLTAFSFTIGAQSWTLADAKFTPINIIGTINPFFIGINSNNTYLYAGISFNGATMITYPQQHFVVGNIGVPSAPADGNFIPINNGLGEFTATGTLSGAVPEPASWALLIAGFGLTGAAMRRRRRTAAA